MYIKSQKRISAFFKIIYIDTSTRSQQNQIIWRPIGRVINSNQRPDDDCRRKIILYPFEDSEGIEAARTSRGIATRDLNDATGGAFELW